MSKRLSVAVILSISLAFAIATHSFAKPYTATIGTGGITGVYYYTGSSLRNMINKKRKEYGIRALVEATAGSVFNINALMNDDLEFGLVQSDRQFQAVNGLANWQNKGPQNKLRAVCSLYVETVTLIAAIDSGVYSVDDLKGKRINIGNPGSGHRINAIHVLEANGINYQKDLVALGAKAPIAPSDLQNGDIDAFFYTVGHPNGAIKEATSQSRKVRFIPISHIDDLLVQFPYYNRAAVPVAMYPGAVNDSDIPTIGVRATLVTSISVPDEIVYAFTKEIFENLDEFKKKHPAFSTLTKESMLKNLYAPIHPGALRYYKEADLK